MPRTEQAQLSGLLRQHLVVIIELLRCQTCTAGCNCQTNRTECLGEFGCGIVSGGSFEERTYSFFVAVQECLVARVVLDVHRVSRDQSIARIEAVADAPALVFDVDEAAQGRGVFDIADEEHLGVDGAGLAFDVLGLFFPGFDLALGNVAGSDQNLNYVI